MQNTLIIEPVVDTRFINKVIKIVILITIAVSIAIPIYHAIDKPSDEPTSISTDTDIDWTKPPCNPDELSTNWKEVTDPRMAEKSSRRIFQYKNTNNKVAFEKGKPGLTGDKAIDHWHRYNPNFKNSRDLYLDIYGNTASKGSPSSHIDPNCN